MRYELTIPAILQRAVRLYGQREVVTRLPDRSFHRYTYADLDRRSRQLASAFVRFGLQSGARIATLCWSHYQHAEMYFAGPTAALVTPPVNPRLHPDDIAYILNHAGDRVLVVDESLLHVWEQVRDRVQVELVIVIGADDHAVGVGYEEFLASGDSDWQPSHLDENCTALLGYTSGTTGRPKGVEVSHRAVAVHSLASSMADFLAIGERDVVLPVVPMYHALAWGWPYSCALLGAKQVLPGPLLDAESLLEDFESEGVTLTGGVPTIWQAVLAALDASPGRWDLSQLRAILSGGSTAPPSMIEGYEKRHGLNLVHTWGMTEMIMGAMSGATTGPPGATMTWEQRLKQGRPMPFVEIRARNDNGVIPWDGTMMGELEVRGAWVATHYIDAPETADRWTADGWFRTGDVVTIDATGAFEIQDRAKDLVKSGGEWISTVALENWLMSHPAVAEAAVVAVPDDRWGERPLAVVVFRPGQSATAGELRGHLGRHFPRWQLPDRIEVVDAIPRTAVGKLQKTVLRERFAAGTE